MNTKEYSVRWIKENHKFIAYYENNNELLHLTKEFGFTNFSNDIDRVNCLLTTDVMYVDKEGRQRNISYKNRSKYCGRELVIFDNEGNVKFDEWVYIDVSKPMHNMFDINGYELTIGG